MKLTPYIHQKLMWILPNVDSRDQLLRELAQRIAEQVDELEAEPLYQALLKREEQGSTATPECVAFPHAMLEEASESFIAVALVSNGVPFDKKNKTADVIFVLIGPKDSAWEHIRLLARLARICHTPGALEAIRASDSAETLYQRLVEEDQRHV